MSKEQMYYLQDSRTYVGNCPMWWAKDSGGYVCNLDNAGLYTYEEAMQLHKDRSTDIPWKQQDVEIAVKRLVDAQYLVKSDEDGFYSNLEQMKKERTIKEQKEHQDYLHNNYINNELFTIRENVDFDNVKDSLDFENEFEKAKCKIEWHEHYYPTAYSKSTDEIFEDLKEYDLIFCCSECKKYLWTCSRDTENTELCEECAIEKFEKENQE